MFQTRKSCGWCHEMVLLAPDGGPAWCPECGHDAAAARMDCTCARCDDARRKLDQRRRCWQDEEGYRLMEDR